MRHSAAWIGVTASTAAIDAAEMSDATHRRVIEAL
jgi:hypothetical protein